LFVVRKQETGDRFAAHDGFLELLKTRGVQRSVPIGVVSQFEPGIEPHVKRFDSRVDFAPLVEPAFIDKPHRGNLPLPQGGEQLHCHFRDRRGGHGIRCGGGQIVDGDGDLTVRGSVDLGIRAAPGAAEGQPNE